MNALLSNIYTLAKKVKPCWCKAFILLSLRFFIFRYVLPDIGHCT
ncbi:hypothetical protein HMPREF0373_02644 [Eubacterium ramulus ATCC 29099]|uniref:Uncharacterized protein n=1 Tax=Eubacterium ramulus ATCC 29099 TaxID=1256908 RepID=U2QVZ9_EUBRA|nr:hypothetical protein HMPREF0373_02644 [Eubacterium ramulus ATCC 29099]